MIKNINTNVKNWNNFYNKTSNVLYGKNNIGYILINSGKNFKNNIDKNNNFWKMTLIKILRVEITKLILPTEIRKKKIIILYLKTISKLMIIKKVQILKTLF